MMSFAKVKSKSLDFFNEASFVSHIHDESDYGKALQLMDELIEEYDTYKPLIELLSLSIERWEENAEEFAEFNASVNALDSGVAALKTLMYQYQLKADDLKEEIGSKSLVSMILNGTRNLTVDHIKALSVRFNTSPAVFIS
jgi:HTH-type transcriptional regulator/antitoxin HigA